MGAFVLPNAPIPDDTPLEKFAMPGKALPRFVFCIVSSPDVFPVLNSGSCGTRSWTSSLLGRSQVYVQTYLSIHKMRGHRQKIR